MKYKPWAEWRPILQARIAKLNRKRRRNRAWREANRHARIRDWQKPEYRARQILNCRANGAKGGRPRTETSVGQLGKSPEGQGSPVSKQAG